jgi:hypothetical protein
MEPPLGLLPPFDAELLPALALPPSEAVPAVAAGEPAWPALIPETPPLMLGGAAGCSALPHAKRKSPAVNAAPCFNIVPPSCRCEANRSRTRRLPAPR